MSTVTFDTLKYAERLEKAGASRELAAAMAEAQRDIFSQGELATKDDLTREIDLLRVEMNGKFLLLQWMMGALIAISIANFAKQFF